MDGAVVDFQQLLAGVVLGVDSDNGVEAPGNIAGEFFDHLGDLVFGEACHSVKG